MFERTILGFDLGSYAVKAAELEAGLRGVRLVRCCSRVLPEGAGPEEREAAVFDFIRELDLPVDFVIAALPADRVTQRHLRFPFSDPKRVAEAIPFEIGDQLPLDLDEVILAHEQTRNAPEQTDVLAVMAPRGEVGAWLEQLRLAGIEPRVLELEGTVLGNLSGAIHVSDLGRVILDVGHRTTKVCLLVDGRPVALRSIPVAGQDLTRALAIDTGLSQAAALERKHAEGIFESGSIKPVGEQVGRTLERLGLEVQRSIEAVAGDRLHSLAPGEVVLCGGSALTPGIERWFGESLGLPCSVLSVPPGDPELEPLVAAGAPVFAQATALALRGSPTARRTRVNFRTGEFAYVPDLGALRRALGFTLGLAALALVLWVAALGSQLMAHRARADALRVQLQVVYQATFPDAGASDNPFAALEAETRETRTLASHLGVTGSGLSALEVLRVMSERIPSDLEVALTELKIERRTIQARGYAADFESVDRIRSVLSSYEAFQDVRLSDVVSNPRSGGKSFNLIIRLAEGT